MTVRTKDFNPEIDTKLTCSCMHVYCDRRSVSQKVLNMAQAARDDLGHSLRVTSGGRCPYHPNEKHRKIPADHQKCQGIDIAADGSTRGNIVAAGIKAGFNAIGVAKTFVHWGYREELPDGHVTMWVY